MGRSSQTSKRRKRSDGDSLPPTKTKPSASTIIPTFPLPRMPGNIGPLETAPWLFGGKGRWKRLEDATSCGLAARFHHQRLRYGFECRVGALADPTNRRHANQRRSAPATRRTPPPRDRPHRRKNDVLCIRKDFILGPFDELIQTCRPDARLSNDSSGNRDNSPEMLQKTNTAIRISRAKTARAEPSGAIDIMQTFWTIVDTPRGQNIAVITRRGKAYGTTHPTYGFEGPDCCRGRFAEATFRSAEPSRHAPEIEPAAKPFGGRNCLARSTDASQSDRQAVVRLGKTGLSLHGLLVLFDGFA